jgi:hypothetical protein
MINAKSKLNGYLGLATLFSLLFELLLVPQLFGQTNYCFEIVAQTGEPFGQEGTIEELGWGPSINDTGNVAYTGRIRPTELEPDSAKEGIFVWNVETKETERRSSWVNSFYYNPVAQISYLDTAFDFGEVVQINNQDRVVWRVEARDGLFGFILRLGSTPQDFKIVSQKYYSRIDLPDLNAESPYAYLDPWVTMNNEGRVVFTGDLRLPWSGTVLSTPVDPASGGHDEFDDFHTSASFAGSPNLFPMITDNDYTLVRAGGSVEDALVLFSDENLASVWGIAEGPEFTSIGSRSGVSDDGVAVAFVANHTTFGGGIFVELPSHSPFKIAGIPDNGSVDPNGAFVDRNGNGQLDQGEEDLGFFATFRLGSRIGVNRTNRNSSNKYTIAYVAKGLNGIDGLYTTWLDASNPLSLRVTEPSLVIQLGDEIAGLSGTVSQVEIYDPVNNTGQLVFWCQTSSGSQAIVRAVPPRLHAVFVGWNIPPLINGGGDALDMYNYFKKYKNWTSSNPFPVYLTPAPGTGALNKNFLKQLIQDMELRTLPGDYFIFYFAGDGGYDRLDPPDETVVLDEGKSQLNTSDEFLLVNSNWPLVTNISDDMVLLDDELRTWLDTEKWRSVNKWVILDTCYAGGFVDACEAGTPPHVGQCGNHDGDLEMLPKIALSAAVHEGKQATQILKFPFLGGRGLFTDVLLKALRKQSGFSFSDLNLMIKDWDVSEWIGEELNLRLADPFLPGQSPIIFDLSYWQPQSFASDDFEIDFPVDDVDSDGVYDHQDNCHEVPNPDQGDLDSDDHGDMCDNCPNLYNPDQLDSDSNGIGDACECSGDRDGDGDVDGSDLTAYAAGLDFSNLPYFANNFGRDDCLK